MQYIAEKWDPSLLGQDIKSKAEADMLSGVLWDAKKQIINGCYSESEKLKLSSLAVTKLEPISKFMGTSKLFLLGQRVSYLDFYLFELL